MPRFHALYPTALALLAWPALAAAQPAFTFDAPKKGMLANLVCVTAPAARCAAVSDSLGLLAFGHDKSYPNAHVSLVRLDAKGLPPVYPISWKLPRPPALAKAGNYPLALAFHPKLPLLYVWQDVAIHYGNPPGPTPPELLQFDHLLIYDVAQDPPVLVTALCRGKAGILHGQRAGSLALDGDGAFLCVPNFVDPKNYGHFQFGRFPLDADGLPDVLGEPDRKLPRAQRLMKLTERNATPLWPPQVTPRNDGSILSYNEYGAGSGFYPLGSDAVVAGGPRGLMLWRPDDKESALNALPLKDINHVLLAAHPTLPLLYATCPDRAWLFRVHQADGYPTLLPERWTLPEKVFSAPAVLGKGSRIAVGGAYQVYLVNLDAAGRPRPELTQVQVFNPTVRALIYSPRFDRLYVSVELSK
jgi:hypothetical protein